MNRMLNHMEDILNEQVSGFHQYVLDDPVHLSYVSENLCKMVGVCPEELLCEDKDLYVSLVHPADRGQYCGFLRRLTQEEQTLISEYRLITKDGAVRYVRDVFTSKRLDNDVLVGCSVLTDITDLKQENHNLRFLNETIPCGFLKYTCEKQPRITYINQKMMEILRFPEAEDGALDELEFYKNNIL